MKKRLIVSIFIAILISSCGGVTPVAETFSVPKIAITHPELEVITPENIKDLEEIGKWGESVIYDAAVSPDKQTIAVRTLDGVHFFDSETLDEINYLEGGVFSSEEINLSVSYSPDGNYLAISQGYTANFYNLIAKNYEKYLISPLPDANISNIEFSKDNNYVIVTTDNSSSYSYCDGIGGNFALYDLTQTYGRLLFDRYFCYPSYSRYRITDNDRVYFFLWYATSPVPYQMDVVDLQTGGLIESVLYDFQDIDPEKTFYDISPDGKIFASAEPNEGDYITRLIDEDTRDVIDLFHGYINFKESLDGSFIWDEMFKRPQDQLTDDCSIGLDSSDGYDDDVVINDDYVSLIYLDNLQPQSIEVWNQSTCKIIKQLSFSPNNKTIFSVKSQFSPDGSMFANVSGYNIEVWDVKTGEVRFVAQNPIFRFPLNVFAFNSDSTRLIASTRESSSYPDSPFKEYSVSVWDTQTGNLLNTIETGEYYVQDIITSPENKFAVFLDNDSADLWNIETVEKISSIPSGQYVFDKTGQIAWMVTLQDQDAILSMYAVKTGELLKRTFLSEKNIREFSLNKNASRGVFVARDQDANLEYLIFIDMQSGKEIYEIPMGGNVTKLESNREYFVTHNSNGNMELWNFQDDIPFTQLYGYYTINTARNFSEFPESKYDFVHNVVFSPNNQILVSLGRENNMRIWDVHSGELLGEFTPRFQIVEINISPDGRLIIVGGKDGYFRVWGVKKH